MAQLTPSKYECFSELNSKSIFTLFSLIYSSSSFMGGPADISGVRLRLSPNVAVEVDFDSGAEDPRTSLIRPEDSAIRRLRAFSSAVETLARCFFNGLPKSPSDNSAAG